LVIVEISIGALKGLILGALSVLSKGIKTIIGMT
jgi:hypothetical protein